MTTTKKTNLRLQNKSTQINSGRHGDSVKLFRQKHSYDGILFKQFILPWKNINPTCPFNFAWDAKLCEKSISDKKNIPLMWLFLASSPSPFSVDVRAI